jgi:hypothetical protein
MITSTPVTFVNFCVDIGRDKIDPNNTIHRSFELYKGGMYENMATKAPLVTYTSIDSPIIPVHRNSSNFRLHRFGIEEIENEFPNFELYKQSYPNTQRDEIESALFYYNPLVVLKMKKMMDVINENPFNSDYFFWIDCHFTRGILDMAFLEQEEAYLKMYENVKNKIEDKFLLFNYANRPYGFFWGGSKTAIKNVYENYFDIYFESLSEKMLTEELLFKRIYEDRPEIFNFMDITHHSGDYKTAVSNYLNN